VHGFDYTALHWADKQKPLPEVAGEFGVFPPLESPPLVPEEIDQKTPLPAAEVNLSAVESIMVERVTVSEQFPAVEDIPERPARPRKKASEAA